MHRELGITTEAWSPLGRGQVLQDPVVLDLAAAHGRTAAQIILRWHVQLGNVAIPKASSHARIRENLDVFGFSLDDAAMARPGRSGTWLPHRLPPRQRQLGPIEWNTWTPSPPPRTPLFSAGLEARTRAAEVVLDGARVAYWTYEPVRVTPETRTILVIHGFRGDHHGLLRVADQLPEMRLIMPDLPGFGSSAAFADAEHSVERYGRFISRLHGGPGPGAGHGPAGPLLRLDRRQPLRGGPPRHGLGADPGQPDRRARPGGAQGRS